MKLSYWILFVALVLSTIAAYYSILGLVTIFSAAALPIIIMASAMEVSKVSVTVWLHRYWTECRLPLKCYLVPAVVILMLITSMGVFGLLSRAHSDQGAANGDIAAKVAIIDEKIRTERENIEANRQALSQMNASVDQTMARSTTEQGAGRAAQIRKSQGKERQTLQTEITKGQERIAKLNEERAPIAIQLRHAEAEVGPIKYVAAMIYGDNPDATMLERSVRWVIVLLVSVFDPLAIFMVLAAQESMRWEKNRKPETVQEIMQDEIETLDQMDDRVEDMEDRLEHVIELLEEDREILEQHLAVVKHHPTQGLPIQFDEEPVIAPPGDEALVYPEMEQATPTTMEWDILPANDGVYQVIEREVIELDDDEPLVKDLRPENVWRLLNPGKTLREQRRLFEQNLIVQLPWEAREFEEHIKKGEYDYLLKP